MKNSDTIKTVTTLIETSKDGEYGFRASAEHARSPAIKALFTTRADLCRKAVAELQSLAAEYGGEIEDRGSASGAMHRGWVAVKGTLAGYSDLALLEECERGEDVALASYRKALTQDLPDDVRAVVERQLLGVKHNHDHIRTLRDDARAASA